jgi:hypothetical protein
LIRLENPFIALCAERAGPTGLGSTLDRDGSDPPSPQPDKTTTDTKRPFNIEIVFLYLTTALAFILILDTIRSLPFRNSIHQQHKYRAYFGPNRAGFSQTFQAHDPVFL